MIDFALEDENLTFARSEALLCVGLTMSLRSMRSTTGGL